MTTDLRTVCRKLSFTAVSQTLTLTHTLLHQVSGILQPHVHHEAEAERERERSVHVHSQTQITEFQHEETTTPRLVTHTAVIYGLTYSQVFRNRHNRHNNRHNSGC